MSDFKLWFGKHSGKRLDEIPRSYLEWCLEARAGGGEAVAAIASFLQVEVPRKKVKYEGQTMTSAELAVLSRTKGFVEIHKFVDGVDVMGVANCEHLFNPEKSDLQPWDGASPPWLDYDGTLDEELRAIIG